MIQFELYHMQLTNILCGFLWGKFQFSLNLENVFEEQSECQNPEYDVISNWTKDILSLLAVLLFELTEKYTIFRVA